MILYTIRHGETEYNKSGLIQGWRDIPLNERGLAQAVCAADFLKEIPFDLIISSPLSRAYTTARIIASASCYDIPIRLEERLREIHLGVLEGQHEKTDFMNIYASDAFQFQAPEGGESYRQLCSRVTGYLDELIMTPEYQDKTILISTHAATSRAVLWYFHDNKEDFWRNGVPYNCSLNKFEISNGTSRILAQDILPTGIRDI